MACSLVSGPGITAITGEDIMDAATAGATTDAATMAVAEMATDLDTVIEEDAALQVAVAIAAGSAEVDFAAETVSTVAEAAAFMAVADSTAAAIAVEDPAVVAIGNFELNTEWLRD